MNKTYHFLVQRADRMGDAIFALPVIETLKQHYPNSCITVLTSSIGKVIFEGHKDVDDIITTSSEHSWLDIVKQARSLRGQYTCYISLWNHPKMAAFGFFAGIPIRIGDTTDMFLALLYTKGVRQSWEQLLRHQIEFNLELLTPLGIKPRLCSATIPLQEDALLTVKTVYQVFKGAKTILIFVGTGGTNSPLPEQSVVEFITLVADHHPEWRVILAGQQREDKLLHTFQHPIVYNIINKTSIQELFSYIYLCDVYIGPDTGPTHIASFMQKPTVFFSSMKPNPPSRWGSLSPILTIIRKDYECPFFCAKKCFSEVCFRIVTGFVLLNAFESCLQAIDHKKQRTIRQTRTYHMVNTLRVLVVSSTKDEWRALENEGVVVIYIDPSVYTITSLSSVIELIIRYNINTIYGISSWMMRWAIRLYMGAIATYVVPVFIQETKPPVHVDGLIASVYKAYEQYVPR